MLKLTYSNLDFQNFPGEDPRAPLFKGREGKGRGGERERKEGGKDREGRGGTGRDRRGKEGGRGGMGVVGRGCGRGARDGLRPPP